MDQSVRSSVRLQRGISFTDREFRPHSQALLSALRTRVCLLCGEVCFGGKVTGFTFSPSQTQPPQEYIKQGEPL